MIGDEDYFVDHRYLSSRSPALIFAASFARKIFLQGLKPAEVMP